MLNFLFGTYGNVYTPVTPRVPLNTPVGQGQFATLQQRVDSLELACAALWKLLKQTSHFTDDQLKALIHEVDAADGFVDGKMTSVGGVCPHCGNRILSRTSGKCLWCGAALNDGPFNQASTE